MVMFITASLIYVQYLHTICVNTEYALIEDHLVLQFTGMFHISLQPLTLNILLSLK